MKKFYFLLLVLCLMSIKTLYSQDVINLGVTDGIGAKLNAYVGTNTDVTVIVPAGYTSPEFATSNIILSAIPATIKNLVIQGDGTNPTLLMKGFTFPASSLTSFTVKDLTMKGLEDVVAGSPLSLGNYLAQSGAVSITSLTIKNCTIANFRGVFRMNSGNSFTNVTIDGCTIRNIGTYNILNTSSGATLTNFIVKNSTVYGVNGNVFASSAVVPATFTISDCTFDNIGYVSGKFFIDLGAANATTVLTITNSLFGKTLNSGFKGIQLGTAYTVSNSYTTTDWVTAANNVTGFTAYANASTSLFKSPSAYDGTNTTAPVGNYSLIDNTVGKTGDPKWYLATSVISPKASSTVISYNGTAIVLNETQDLNVYSITGELLKSAKKVNLLSVANLPKGAYIVKAGTATHKFIVY